MRGFQVDSAKKKTGPYGIRQDLPEVYLEYNCEISTDAVNQYVDFSFEKNKILKNNKQSSTRSKKKEEERGRL